MWVLVLYTCFYLWPLLRLKRPVQNYYGAVWHQFKPLIVGVSTQTPEFYVILIRMLCLHLAIVLASYVEPFHVLWSCLCPLIFHQLCDD